MKLKYIKTDENYNTPVKDSLFRLLKCKIFTVSKTINSKDLFQTHIFYYYGSLYVKIYLLFTHEPIKEFLFYSEIPNS